MGNARRGVRTRGGRGTRPNVGAEEGDLRSCGRRGPGTRARTERGDGGRSVGDGEETYGRADGGVEDPRRTEGEPSGGRARRDEWERTMEELDESDIRACGGYLPLGRTELASGTLGETETEGVAWTVARGVEEGSDVDAGGDDLLRGVVIADCGEAFPRASPPPPPSAAPPPRGGGAEVVKV